MCTRPNYAVKTKAVQSTKDSAATSSIAAKLGKISLETIRKASASLRPDLCSYDDLDCISRSTQLKGIYNSERARNQRQHQLKSGRDKNVEKNQNCFVFFCCFFLVYRGNFESRSAVAFRLSATNPLALAPSTRTVASRTRPSRR